MEECVKKEITYFFEPGPQNTECTLFVAKGRAMELGISTFVMPSDSGATAKAGAKILLPDFSLIIVTNPWGGLYKVRRLWNCYPRSQKLRKSYEEKGIKSFPYYIPNDVAKELLEMGATVLYIDWKRMKEGNRYHRRFLWPLITISQGLRVAYLVAMFAQLQGLLSGGEEVISMGGTGHCGGGLDTAVVLRVGHRFFHWELKEIIAMPRSCSKYEFKKIL
jgi:hypothetical protein